MCFSKKRVNENLLLKGCHTKILSLLLFMAVLLVYQRYAVGVRLKKYIFNRIFVPAKSPAQIRMHKMHVKEWRKK